MNPKSSYYEKANELYPNNRTFCGGVAQIAREAYVKGSDETLELAIQWLKEHASEYIVNLTESCPDAPFQANIGSKCWEYLKKECGENQ